MQERFTLTGLVMVSIFLLAAQVVVPPGSALGQDIGDITGDKDQYGISFPGISCKTRTNNEDSVRNLAHGVNNRDSDTRVLLNCGIPTPHAVAANKFPNDARIRAEIFVTFGRTDSVSDEDFEDAFCNIYVSWKYDEASTPAAPSSTAVSLGQVGPEAPYFSDLIANPSIVTSGVAYPSPNATANFISLFCGIPRGVRIQNIDLFARGVEAHP